MQIELLDENGLLKMLPANTYDRIPWPDLRVWCHLNARYGLPTTELIAWLRGVIGTRKAIEIGSGSGDLSHMLGIPATDSRMQEDAAIQKIYKAMADQPVIKYPDFVEKLEAEAAMEKYQPEVIVASWITQWTSPKSRDPGSPFGVHEHKIITRGITYVLIGNIAVHGKKKIMKVPHEVYDLPFVRSRAHNPELNRVWIWNRR